MTDNSASSGSSGKMHQLKVWPEFFAVLCTGTKTFEVRKNDRDFHAGDTLSLHEWDPHRRTYTGRWIEANVSYLSDLGLLDPALKGYVAMQLSGIQKGPRGDGS